MDCKGTIKVKIFEAFKLKKVKGKSWSDWTMDPFVAVTPFGQVSTV